MVNEYLEWDSGHREDENHRWKFPNQSCGVRGSAYDIFDREKHSITVRLDAEKERLNHACVAKGYYDPHVYYQGVIAAWEREYAEVSAALEIYASTAPADEAGKIVPTVRRELAASKESIAELKANYADIAATADRGWAPRGRCAGGSCSTTRVAGVPIATDYSSILMAAVAAIGFLVLAGAFTGKGTSVGGGSANSYSDMR